MSFDNALWKAVLTGIASNMYAAIMAPQTEAWFIWKDNSAPINLPCSVLMSPLQMQKSMACLYKGTLACSPRRTRCSQIDETDISTPVAVDQSAANCLEEDIRSFTTMGSRCRSSLADFTFRRSSISKFISLWNCLAAQDLLLRNRKILFLEGR